ncbi:MAG TPA: transcription termination factor NusA [Pirellulaceae bacterium]|nr:transcription termination factor NusA [Pirellulaceae bacterium]HMO92161.1 transcription termination factor NusA [Pirellulaceae bacterium]HMP68913.1 transcription termination factor NusA [Pirellulaceae bacterium]
MDANQILRLVDSFHRDKNIDKEVVFVAIESALVSAARKQFGEEALIEFNIDRNNGSIQGAVNGSPIDYEELIGRIGAQTAKQVIIQKLREAERDSLLNEFRDQIDELVSGTVNRNEGSVTTVSLGSVEAILPRSEQIPGETHQNNERLRALVTEVKTQGPRLKVVLSRTRPRMVQRLFEQEIPEINEGVITINAIAREPGYRSKVAVSSVDSKVDCVGACVGLRGNRIKNITDELAGERIDIVRWEEDPQAMIRNALQPANVDEVILCRMMGRAIVLVADDQLSLAIGKRGQNVRLASKLCGWDIEIMTHEELESQIERAVIGFSEIDGIDEELANRLVEKGFLSYDDLSVIEPDDLAEMGQLTMEQVDHIVAQAEARAEEAERIAEENKKKAQAERQQQKNAGNSQHFASGDVEETASDGGQQSVTTENLSNRADDET